MVKAQNEVAFSTDYVAHDLSLDSRSLSTTTAVREASKMYNYERSILCDLPVELILVNLDKPAPDLGREWYYEQVPIRQI